MDWLDTAQNHYAVAAQNTKMVGQEIGLFIDWLEVCVSKSNQANNISHVVQVALLICNIVLILDS